MVYQLTALTTQSKVKTMTLSYRGLKYETSAVSVNSNIGITAKYRGLIYRKHPRTTLERQVCQLRYRGLTYNSVRFK
jgi:hypothetical protein